MSIAIYFLSRVFIPTRFTNSHLFVIKSEKIIPDISPYCYPLRQVSLKIINYNLVNAVHDVSNGGLLVALSEMSIGSNFGVKISKSKKLTNIFGYFFGEDQGRYIVEIDKNNLEKVEKILKNDNIYYENIGFTQKDYFEIDGELKINIKELYKINNEWYNNY